MSNLPAVRHRFLWTLAAILTASTHLLETAAKKSQSSPMEIRFAAASMDYVNSDYLGPSASVRIARKSRSSPPSFNAFLPFLQDLPPDTNITFQSFQKINNAWRATLIKGHQHVCRTLESKSKYERMMFNFSDFPTRCPVKKGNYSILDFHVAVDTLPALVPSGIWRTHFSWGTTKVTMLSYSFECRIELKGVGHHSGISENAFVFASQTNG